VVDAVHGAQSGITPVRAACEAGSVRHVSEPPVLDVDLTLHDRYRGGFPHDLFRSLRDEHPVWRHPAATLTRSPEGIEFWVVLGHAEVQAVARDWKTFSSLDGASLSPTADDQRGHNLVSADPPGHTRLRKLISAGFTPRMIRRLDEQIAARTTRVLDEAAAAGECNFVQDVAFQVPMHTIADILGIPEADRPEVFAWTDTIMAAPDPEAGISRQEHFLAGAHLYEYARALGEDKRRHPTDDVWSILTTAEVTGDDGEVWRLSVDELDQFFLILTIAGSETTRSAISGGLVALQEHPDQWQRLRADPALLPHAVEEIIRWVTPVACFARTSTCDVELDGVRIAAGDRVSMWFPAANRDPRSFDEPDRFDVGRDPNPHVAFGGGGAHFCLGAHLARNEIRTMLAQLVTRFPDVEITGPPSYLVSAPEQTIAVALRDLPVRLVP
jgi:cytochrome P450